MCNFAKSVRQCVKRQPRTILDLEEIEQLIRASGATDANDIDAGEAVRKKSYRMRITICCKKAKEHRYLLHLLDTGNRDDVARKQTTVIQESTNLTNIHIRHHFADREYSGPFK